MFMLVDALYKDMLFYRIVGVISTVGHTDGKDPGVSEKRSSQDYFKNIERRKKYYSHKNISHSRPLLKDLQVPDSPGNYHSSFKHFMERIRISPIHLTLQHKQEITIPLSTHGHNVPYRDSHLPDKMAYQEHC